jgi:ureidoacrylate peracid hydrolase
MNPDDLAPGRTALLLIDWQVDFAAPDGAMAGAGRNIAPARAALEQAAALLAAARAAGVTVVFGRLEAPLGEGALCVAGTPGAEFFGIAPRAGEQVISKTRYSAFAGTGLADSLKAKGIETLVLSGLTTDCCVASSAWAAFEADFQVVIARDGCAAYEDDLHAVTLRALALSGATLLSATHIARTWKECT